MVGVRPAHGTAGRWLTIPSRVAGLGRRDARLVLTGWTVLLIVAAIIASSAPTMPEFLHDAIVAAIRHGGEFYESTRDLLRTEPDAYAAMALPAPLAVIEAALPRGATMGLIAAALTALLWTGGLRLGGLFARASGVVMVVSLLAGGIVATAGLWMTAPHAGAAATLSAIAIVARRHDRYVAASAIACSAALLDPAALVTIVVMGVSALIDGSRREAGAWLGALTVASSIFVLHLNALQGVVLSDHAVGAEGNALARLVGAAFPTFGAPIAAPLLLMSAIGWTSIGDTIGVRVMAVMIGGVALDGIMGLRCATLIAPLAAPGLALAAGSIGELARAALDRRRITVTRVTR
ncbi:hypothetical protein ASE95_00585 [Sphingomonas sp. Leaf231]|uniref:hypothetical protein n=1 Tax=Sphingomonas sp. Leaf231 TaxID=1736301 RepID=UPI0006FB6779|nr:hypothetical protein [Sphingomonas sp. Leaf231]KQN93490.1 hypothetical protein ASE95_00585 [Sphingomonas sp. Leaf231]